MIKVSSCLVPSRFSGIPGNKWHLYFSYIGRITQQSMTTGFHPHKSTIQTVRKIILTVKLYYNTCFLCKLPKQSRDGNNLLATGKFNYIFYWVVFTLFDTILDCNISFYEHLYKLEDYIRTGNGILTTGI